MKKLLAFVLAMTIVLSLGIAAYAAPSPHRGGGSSEVTSYDLPAVIRRYLKGEAGKKITIIANGDLTDEQRATVDKALGVVTGEGFLPDDSYLILVDEDGQTYVIVELYAGEYVFVVDDKGSFTKFGLDDLERVGESLYKVPLNPGVVSFIIAKEK